MGVACRTPNHFACDRIGLAIYLREPAQRVEAQIDGRDFELKENDLSQGRDFTGYLQPAGLLDGSLELSPDASNGRWIGREHVSTVVTLWVDHADGEMRTTELEIGLNAGWG
ncbi:MAG: hypothetical protein QOI31_582 [Solirubrobacterales bacterium]|jgi:hypothetical protein|nr:hypothetical protein [Solirubrobacterales bacterium]